MQPKCRFQIVAKTIREREMNSYFISELVPVIFQHSYIILQRTNDLFSEVTKYNLDVVDILPGLPSMFLYQ